MYGETADEHPQSCRHVGLSPHVRGNPERSFHARPDEGSIPACTGKPVDVQPFDHLPQVYPRMYGETQHEGGSGADHVGLSPHVRGNLVRFPPGRAPQGSIPACTGKPRRRGVPRRPPWVYPRMYGETAAVSRATYPGLGLSPHVRGNQRFPRSAKLGSRSIPACTGKPTPPAHRRERPRVYPRMYGETVERHEMFHEALGLSPHVRGNRGRHRGRGSQKRSIPACTGKPDVVTAAALAVQVYPRMYGET